MPEIRAAESSPLISEVKFIPTGAAPQFDTDAVLNSPG